MPRQLQAIHVMQKRENSSSRVTIVERSPPPNMIAQGACRKCRTSCSSSGDIFKRAVTMRRNHQTAARECWPAGGARSNSLKSTTSKPDVNTVKQTSRQHNSSVLFPHQIGAFCTILLLTLAVLLINEKLLQCADGVDQVLFKYNEQEKTSDFWLQSGRQALNQALRYQPNNQRAKNSVIFIGDGMSLSTITAARILYGQLLNKSGEEEQLSFEKLNNVALIKTYNVDQQVPDSAATATAILCGVKSNFYTLGVNANVRLNETNCQKIQQNHVQSILKQAQDSGKSTGIITNTRITHATPAAGYAHVSNRRWECDSFVPKNLDPNCKDIARQLIEDEPGNKMNVIMGGGRRCFFGPSFVDPGPANQKGIRQDDRNLIDQWLDQRRSNNERNFAFVNSTQDLRSVDVDKTDYLLGLFSFSHMNYEELRDQSASGEPSLSEMTEIAIKILSKNPNGYLLLVEGGRIDHAHHENVAGVALRETIALSWAVQAARNMIDPRDTLLAVTSDHAHALTINGLAPRGNPILGLSRFKENATQVPYTTLIYGNGPGNQRPRLDPSVGPNSTDSPYYVQYAAVHQEEAFHDGSDVAIFASGPFAHLFQGVQEQSYIAHVFAYAMCIGDYTNQPHCKQDPPAVGNSISMGRADQTAEASTRTTNFMNGNPSSVGGAGGSRLMQSPPSRFQQSSSASGDNNNLVGSPSLFKQSSASRLTVVGQSIVGGGGGFASLSIILAAIVLLVGHISAPRTSLVLFAPGRQVSN